MYCDIASQQELPDLGRDDVTRIAHEIREAGFREVIFVGGEPLLSAALPAALSALGASVEKAVFTGGIPGDPTRFVEALAGADRLVASIDAATDAENDRVRGREGITRALFHLLEAAAARLPDLYLSVNTVVSKHNVENVASMWGRVRSLGPTSWSLTVAGENFEKSPLVHLAPKRWLAKLYFEIAPALARRVRADGAELVVLPIPLPWLEAGISPDRWDDPGLTLSDEVHAELERFARGDHNRAFVERYGCPLVGRDITIGVAGDVHPCSQAPIIKRAYVMGNLRDRSLADILAGSELAAFGRGVPHPPCTRCWAPSNVPAPILRALVRKASA